MSMALLGPPCRDDALKRKTGTVMVPRDVARHSTGQCEPWIENGHGQALAAALAGRAQPCGWSPIRYDRGGRTQRPCHNRTATRQQRYQPDAEGCATDSQHVYSVPPVPEHGPAVRKEQAPDLVFRDFIAWPLPAAGAVVANGLETVFLQQARRKKTVAGVIRVGMAANGCARRGCRVRVGANLITIGHLDCCNNPCAEPWRPAPS